MIYDTTFKNLVVNSIDTGANDYGYTRLNRGLLVVYSGEMPTYEQFVADWTALYEVHSLTSGHNPVDNLSGSNVISAYGSTANESSFVSLNNVNNEVYLDTTTPPNSRKLRDGTPGFAMLILDTMVHTRLRTYSSGYPANWMEHQPFLLLSVSDTEGDGIVKLSTMDTTISSNAPTLMSIEFEVNLGE